MRANLALNTFRAGRAARGAAPRRRDAGVGDGARGFVDRRDAARR